MSALSDEYAVNNKSLIDDANNQEDSRFAVSSDENVSDKIVSLEQRFLALPYVSDFFDKIFHADRSCNLDYHVMLWHGIDCWITLLCINILFLVLTRGDCLTGFIRAFFMLQK